MLQDGTLCFQILCIAPLSAFDIFPLIHVETSQSPLRTSTTVIIRYDRNILVSLGSGTSWHGGFSSLCRAISSLSLWSRFARSLCVCLLSPLHSEWFCSIGLWSWCSYMSSLVRCAGGQAGRLDCAFLYGVIAIGVVYQEMFSRSRYS